MRFFLLIAMFFPIILFGQNPSVELDRYVDSGQVEKLYVAHDKPFYIPGDIIWTKIWMIDGITHKHLDSIETNRDARAGDYILRAYTLYQLNFNKGFLFQKSIKLLNGNSTLISESSDGNQSFDVQIFPEGGYLINNVESQIAFEVKDSLGPIEEANVIVKDEDGKVVVSTSTNKFGLGKFKLKPALGAKFQLIVNNEDRSQKVDIPRCLVAGAVLRIDSSDSDSIDLKVTCSNNVPQQTFKLIGHIRGIEIYNIDINTTEGIQTTIARSELPSGTIHFTLFDAYGRPISERLIYNENPSEGVQLEVELSASTIQRGGRVEGLLKPTSNGKIVPSSIVMSAYNANLVLQEINGLDIQNYLLVQSDIKEPITDLSGYFESGSTTNWADIDLLMMSHQWRRFNWLSLEEELNAKMVFPKESGYSIMGKVVNRFTNKPVKADVMLTAMNKRNDFINASLVTADDGLFVFNGLDLVDSTDIFIESGKKRKAKKNKKNVGKVAIRGDQNVDIDWIQYERMPIERGNTYPSSIDSLIVEQEKVIPSTNYISSYELEGDEWSIDLDEVTFSANMNKGQLRDQGIKNRYKELGIWFISSATKFEVPLSFLEEKIHADIFDVITQMVPLARRHTVDNQKTLKYNGGEPAFFVDGQKMTRQQLAFIDPRRLNYIDIIGSTLYEAYKAKTVYGDSLVFHLILKDKSEIPSLYSGTTNITFPGYHQTRTFYRKANIAPEVTTNGKDYSTSLYWNPDIKISDQGYEFSFEAADLPGRHCIYIQGLSDDGIPFVQKKYFYVE